jgi:dihydrofolate reductase
LSAVRTLIVVNMMTLDGYYTGPGNDVSVMPYDGAFEEYNTERLREADTVLLGGTSYREFSGFWPPLAESPDATPGAREFARLYNRTEKVVVSGTMTPGDLTGIWKDSTRIIDQDAAAAVAGLLQEPGKDVVTWASRGLWTSLVTRGIEVELHLVIGNTAIGAGVPLFEGLTGVELSGLGTPRRLPNSESVLLTYRVRAGRR